MNAKFNKYVLILVAISFFLCGGCEKMKLKNKYIKKANEKFVENVDPKLKAYDIKFEDTKNECKFIYTPKKLQFGGGAEIIIDKKSSEIKKVIRYQ